MLKKFGTVAVGVTAGLVAMAPFASAGEAPQDSGEHSHGHHKSHGDPHGHGKNNANGSCTFDAGDADALSDISGDSLTDVVTQAPVGGNNALNLLNCSSFLNDNANGNFAGNHVSVFGDNALIGD